MLEFTAFLVIGLMWAVLIVFFGFLVVSVAIWWASPAAKAERFERKLRKEIRKL